MVVVVVVVGTGETSEKLNINFVSVRWPLKEPLFSFAGINFLTSESVQSAALALQSVDDVHGGDGLPLGMLGVRHGIADHVLEEHLQHAASLLVDQAGDTLHATTTSQTTDCRLGDALDVVTQHLPVTLGATFAQTFASLAASSHFCRSIFEVKMACRGQPAHLI